MNIEYMTIKPGSILLQKDYNWIVKLWYKLVKKELKFNKFTIFTTDCDLINIHGEHRDAVIAEPKKAYSKKELKRLNTFIDSSKKEEGDWLSSDKATVSDLFIAINCVRPDTFESKNNLNAFLDNKYYNIKELSDEANWSEYIF